MRRRIMVLAVMLVGMSAHAFYDMQSVVLKKGWNAFYLRVQPDKTPDELFASWPVDSVSMYQPDAYLTTRQDNASALSNEVTPERPFLIWSRLSKAASTMNVVLGDAIYVCYNKGESFTAEITGRPVAPRIQWHTATLDSEALNYVGFSLQQGATVTPAQYFRGGDSGVDNYKMIYGADAANILFMTLGDSFTVKDGDVVLADATKASEWSGVLNVSPRHGVDFGTARTLATVFVRNDGATNMTVEAAWVRGTAPDSGAAAPELMGLKYRDVSSVLNTAVWCDFGNGTNKTLAAGETWKLQFGLDRSQPLFGSVAAGTEVGGVLRFRDATGISKMEVKIPASATAQPLDSSVWSAGLWAVDLNLDAVTMVKGDSLPTDGIASGGKPKLRVYLHVANDGKMTLLQRTTIVAQTTDSAGSSVLAAYGPEKEIPSNAQRVVRLSSAFLPVDVPAIEGSGEFLSEAEFSFTVAGDSPSNPFRHPFHPGHDGLDPDRSKALPDGTDFANYASTVKPELFSVGNMIRLEWDTGSTSNIWDPDDELEGTCRWTFKGLRREGDMVASGKFVMRRILKNGVLIH